MMAALISLLHGSAGEAGQRSAVELLHRLVARVDENRLVFVKEPRAIASLVKLLQSPDAATVCDAAWIIGILSTWGAREDVIKQGAFQQLQKLLQASADPDIQVAAQFALRSL